MAMLRCRDAAVPDCRGVGEDAHGDCAGGPFLPQAGTEETALGMLKILLGDSWLTVEMLPDRTKKAKAFLAEIAKLVKTLTEDSGL